MALAHIRIAVERGVRRGVTLGMAVAEAHSHADLGGITGFPISESLAGYSHLLPRYEEMADFVLGLAPADQILGGGSRGRT